MTYMSIIQESRNKSAIIASTALCLFVFLAFALPVAQATSTSKCSPTNCNVHNGTFDLGNLGTNPCTGVDFSSDLVVTGNVHFSSSADGSHFTATVEGIFTISQADGVTYTGHTVASFRGNIASDGHAEFSGTNNFHGIGTDGSAFGIHANTHMTILPNGTITSNVIDVVCR